MRDTIWSEWMERAWQARVMGDAPPPVLPVDDGAKQVAVEYVGEYLALKAQIGALEEQADEARAAAIEALHAADALPGVQWVFEGLGTVLVVKGRETEKLDRKALARAGVAPEVLDAATTVTVGKPSVRINRWTDSEDDDRMAAAGWKKGDADAAA